MSPEEKAVIAKAAAWADWRPHAALSDNTPERELTESLRALRESRQPKPRWGVHMYHALGYLTFDGQDLMVSSNVPGAIEAIAKALNAAAEARP